MSDQRIWTPLHYFLNHCSFWELHILLRHWGGVSFQGYRCGRRERELLRPDENIQLTTFRVILACHVSLTPLRSVVELLPTDGNSWTLTVGHGIPGKTSAALNQWKALLHMC